ncbi:MAG: methyltransferase domain-containing protein [Verrucomicrobium sp.]|nr:methyltransferase domain-containing protein [Verrucomicrobium sp.]
MRRDFAADHPEWMDKDEADPAALREQLRRLEQINRWFGGHAAVRRTLRALLPRKGPAAVADLASGFGDHARLLASRRPDCLVLAVDRHAATLHLAREATPPGLPVFFIQADLKRLPFRDGALDAAYCSLALHHFSEQDAVTVLREARRVARNAAVVDLVRGRLAYAAVWLLTQLWMRDAATRHDGRLSVRRSFTPAEFVALARRAGWKALRWTRLPWFRQAMVSRG